MIKRNINPEFDIVYKGFRVRAWYLDDNPKYKNSEEHLYAWIEIRRKGKYFRCFRVWAYKIYNIAAHFSDMVNNEISRESVALAVTPIPGVILDESVNIKPSDVGNNINV